MIMLRNQQTRFTTSKMRETLYAWHGGMSSAIYAAASSGLVSDVEALQSELQHCAQLVWDDKGNHKAPCAQGGIYIRAKALDECNYLRDLADALPNILGPAVVAFDGKSYRTFPWAKLER